MRKVCTHCSKTVVDAPQCLSCGGALVERTPEATIQKAKEEVFRLCVGRGRLTSNGLAGRDWTMCIPRQSADSDSIFMELVHLAETLLK